MIRHSPARQTDPAPKYEPGPGAAFAFWRAWLKDLAVSVVGAAVGTMLVLLPWTPSWDQNFFSDWAPWWYSVWVNPYFRGAVSGVGALNLYVVAADLWQAAARWWVQQRDHKPNR